MTWLSILSTYISIAINRTKEVAEYLNQYLSFLTVVHNCAYVVDLLLSKCKQEGNAISIIKFYDGLFLIRFLIGAHMFAVQELTGIRNWDQRIIYVQLRDYVEFLPYANIQVILNEAHP